MNESFNRDDAARSIEDIRWREHQVITATTIPIWYWWLVAVGTLVLGMVIDGRSPAVITVTAVVFAVATAAVTVWVILGAGSGAQVSRDLLGSSGPASIVLFVGIVVLAGLAVAFALQARGASHPATAGTAVTAVCLVVGGPILMRLLHQQMRRHSAIPSK
jgi:prepilin signal peptidase PulO-like enzyme (type II secretory pathway)